jgi:putative chitinase
VLTIDATILTKLAPHYTGPRAKRQAANIRLAGPFFPAALARHDITTLLRKAHFLAQVCEESWGFSDMKEEGSGEEYEGRRNLGNTSPGDGPRYLHSIY